MSIRYDLFMGGEKARRLPDPSGGFFDAAGGFAGRLSRYGDRLTSLAFIHEWEEVWYEHDDAPALLSDVEFLLGTLPSVDPERNRTTEARQHRGLLRLREMVRVLSEHEGARLRAQGCA